MKPITILSIVLLLLCVALVRCAKRKEYPMTSLLITLKDTAKIPQPVAGATVRIYKDSADPGLTQISDAGGIVIFPNLDIALYHWIAQKGCADNKYDPFKDSIQSINGAVVYGYSLVAETGVLQIINSTAEPYVVTDSFSFNAVLHDTVYINHHYTGPYKIHNEQVSTPGIGKDTIIQITCGDTSILNIPY